MSNIKSSFVLYNDLIDTTDDLSDEEAGKLFKMILARVNEREFKNDDRLLKHIFIPIEKTLSRDLTKYENKLREKSNAGAIGNLKRWNPDIYNDFTKGKIDLGEALEIAKSRKNRNSDKPIANIADSDSDSDSDSVPENVLENDDVVDENKETDLNANARYFFKNEIVVNAFMEDFRINRKKLIQKIKVFNSHCTKCNKLKKTPKDYREHLNNWLKKQGKNTNSIDKPYSIPVTPIDKYKSGKLERF